MKIGYIGLGLMGKPCVLNLLKAGYPVHIWGRTRQKAEELITAGSVWHETPADLAASVDIVFTNVTNTDDVHQVIFGKDGIADGGKAGLIIADMSTISATATRQMANELKASGIILADCPVSGGTAGAINGTLTVMVGTDPDSFEKLKPVLEVMGSRVTRIGDVGAGQVCKSCNQMILTSTLLGISEAFKLAGKMDVDIVKIREALLGGFANSKVLEMHALRMINDDYTPGFKTELHLKDMNIVKQLGSELGLALETSKLGIEALAKAVEAGYAEVDSSSIFKVIEQ